MPSPVNQEQILEGKKSSEAETLWKIVEWNRDESAMAWERLGNKEDLSSSAMFYICLYTFFVLKYEVCLNIPLCSLRRRSSIIFRGIPTY